MFVWIYVCLSVSMCVCISVSMYVCMYNMYNVIYVGTRVRACIRLRSCICMHAYTLYKYIYNYV